MNREGEMGIRIHLPVGTFFYYVSDYRLTVTNTVVYGIALRQETQNHSGLCVLSQSVLWIAPDSVFIFSYKEYSSLLYLTPKFESSKCIDR